jgi:hypothetical protein
MLLLTIDMDGDSDGTSTTANCVKHMYSKTAAAKFLIYLEDFSLVYK